MSYPQNFLLQNDFSTKFLNMVVAFEGTSITFSLVQTFKKLKWGDPISWGDSGILWGGLIPLADNYPILSTNSNLVIDQKIEPEQGRGSASTLSLEFVDLNQFMTNFVTPGKVLNDVLGGKLVTVSLGYQNTSYKSDYLTIFRGYVTTITSNGPKMTLGLTDANSKRIRQQIFAFGKTKIFQVTKTFAPADVNIVTDIITIANHDLYTDNDVKFFTTGTLPSALNSTSDFFIQRINANQFKVKAAPGISPPLALGSTGSGVMTVQLQSVGTVATVIPVDATSDLVQPIIGPNGSVDTALKVYLKTDNEIMIYPNASFSVSTSGLYSLISGVTRGQRGSTLSPLAVGATSSNVLELEGNIVDNSLKLMLSGWQGPWISNVPIENLSDTQDVTLGVLGNAIILPDPKDAVDDYGLAIGDYIYISGALFGGNNGQAIVTGFVDLLDRPNAIILTDKVFTVEIGSLAKFSSRSQFDTLPEFCGSKLRPQDVDVQGWIDLKTNFFNGPQDVFRHFITKPQNPKTFIESEYLLPSGLYSVTKFGRLSVAYTKPPLAGSNLVVLDSSNVINPQTSVVTRSTVNRRFFNEVQYAFDYDDSGNNQSLVIRVDTTSLNVIDTSSVLPIPAQGLRTSLGAVAFIDKRIGFILNRYSNGAIQIQLKTNWKAAALIEVSDIVALYDNGTLLITNLETGVRDMGNVLMEVIQRSIDIKTGTGTLTLLNSTGYKVSDRFAGIAPSSLLNSGSTTTEIVIKDSFSAAFPFRENEKWRPIIGDLISVHSDDFTFYEEVTLISFVDGSNYRMIVDPPLSIAPPAGYIVDCAVYPDTILKSDQAKSKLLFSFIDPTLTVVSGISNLQFTVSAPDSVKIFPGLPVLIRSVDFTSISSEAIVDTVIGTTVTLKTSIEFTPTVGMLIELIGFKDGDGPYRVL